MIILKNEQSLLNIIKLGPILFVFIIAAFFTESSIRQQNDNFENELNIIKSEYLESNKYRVKEEVERVHKLLTVQKEASEVTLKKELKNKVYEAHSIATNLFNKYKTTKSKEEITALIREALRDIRFNDGRGYFYILTTSNATNILNGFQPSLEGKKLYDLKDSKGKFLNREIIKVIKKDGEGFVDYFWYKPNTDKKMYQKFTFSKEFKPYSFYIGTGEYLVDHENSLKERVLKQIRSVRYANDRYIFIYDMDGVCYSHYNSKYFGKNRLTLKDKNGRNVVKDILTFTKEQKSGFYEYIASIKTDKSFQNNNKISYVKYFKAWDWMIGSGFYLDGLSNQIALKKENLEKINYESIKNIIYQSIIFTIVFIVISFYISNRIKRKFNDYTIQVKKETDNTIKKEKLLIQQSKMATMGEMLGSIAHQWKQPIGVISMSSSILRMAKDDKDLFTDKQVNESFDYIDNAVNNLTQTIDDFRNFFNPNKERTLFKIEDAVNETFKLTLSQFKNNNIEVISSIDDTSLFGSQNELQQTLINLLKNAKEALVKKEPHEKRLLFIESYKENEKIIIKIKDNANGIHTDIIDKVFDSYFTTKEKEGGNGIGLYMCKQIVEGNMKGSITVSNLEYNYENISYNGAEFTIVIPFDLRHNR